MKKQAGIVPIVVLIIIGVSSFLAGGVISFFVFGKIGVASISLGLVLGIIVAPTIMKFAKRWVDQYEKK